jgi:hypothetical protein
MISSTEQFVPPDSQLTAGLMQMITGKWLTQAIYVAAHLNIADHLKARPLSITELAEQVGVAGLPLYRLLRALASVGIFLENEQAQFDLTPLSALLISDNPASLRDMALMMGMNSTWQAWGELLYSVQTGQPAFEKVHGSPNFVYFAQNPQEAEIFNRAMLNLSNGESRAIVASYNFDGVTKLVDVGGGYGTLLAAILKANPGMSGLLFELPHAIEGAKQFLAAQNVLARCEILTGDFNEAIPSGGDAYLLKNIIHGCNDEQAVAVLQKCREAMPASGKLLIVENVVPAGNMPHFAKFLDLEMLVNAGGRERTAEEYRQLFEAANFNLTSVVPTFAPVSVLEGVPA